MFEYEIIKDIADIGKTGKALKLIRWGDNPAKLDLRTWIAGEDGLRPGKGLTLSKDEAKELSDALQLFLVG